MVERAHAHGVSRVILFGLPAHKDERGSSAWDENGVVQQGIRKIKALAPEMYIVTDVCMCEYTSHGHCGILCGHDVDNDKTLEVLAKTAVSHVRAGADMVAPSDMMDGRVAAIRRALDENGFIHVPVSYTHLGALLRGETVGVRSDFPVDGRLPAHISLQADAESGFAISYDTKAAPFAHTLHLVPRLVHIGIGCRRGTPVERIEAAVRAALGLSLIHI